MWIACADACQEKNHWVCRGDLRGHEFVQDLLCAGPNGTILEEFVEIRCCNCGTIASLPTDEWQQIIADEIRVSSRRKAGLTKYPYVEPQSGVLVKSKEHREEVWRAKGLKEWKHDGDESGFTDTDHQIKQRYAPREPGWRNLRRKMGA
jgi:hypothetical protein